MIRLPPVQILLLVVDCFFGLVEGDMMRLKTVFDVPAVRIRASSTTALLAGCLRERSAPALLGNAAVLPQDAMDD